MEPHQIMTSRAHPFSSLKVRMSARICSAMSRLLAPVFLLGPSSRVTYSVSKAAAIGDIAGQVVLDGIQVLCAENAGVHRTLVRVCPG